MKNSCCLFVDFLKLLLSLLICTGEYICMFFFLVDTWCCIYFGAPISTKCRSISLPHHIKLIRTCCYFSSLSYMKETKHGNSGAIAPCCSSRLREEHSYRDIEVTGPSHWNVQNIGIKYLYFRKKISERNEMFFDARFIFQGQKSYMPSKTFENLFYPNLFCCKHIESKTDF